MSPERAFVITTGIACVLVLVGPWIHLDPLLAIGAMFGAGVMLTLQQRPGQGGQR